MVHLGCSRTTKDVDILVPALTNVHKLLSQLASRSEYCVEGSVLYIKPLSQGASPPPIKLDILTGILEQVTLDDLAGYTTVVGGITMLTLPVNLTVKIRYWYTRAEDENGLRKQRTDLEDILFLAKAI